jgi:hypothetical protein
VTSSISDLNLDHGNARGIIGSPPRAACFR